MKKLNKVALMFASAALLSGCGVMSTTAPAGAGRVVAANGGTVVDNWQNGTGQYVWRNGTNELCWRDANWTPATAAVGCDGALVRAAAPAPVAASILALSACVVANRASLMTWPPTARLRSGGSGAAARRVRERSR